MAEVRVDLSRAKVVVEQAEPVENVAAEDVAEAEATAVLEAVEETEGEQASEVEEAGEVESVAEPEPTVVIEPTPEETPKAEPEQPAEPKPAPEVTKEAVEPTVLNPWLSRQFPGHEHAALGCVAGLAFALVVLFVGIPQAVFIAFCMAVGTCVGMYFDGDRRLNRAVKELRGKKQ